MCRVGNPPEASGNFLKDLRTLLSGELFSLLKQIHYSVREKSLFLEDSLLSPVYVKWLRENTPPPQVTNSLFPAQKSFNLPSAPPPHTHTQGTTSFVKVALHF